MVFPMPSPGWSCTSAAAGMQFPISSDLQRGPSGFFLLLFLKEKRNSQYSQQEFTIHVLLTALLPQAGRRN